MKMKIPNNGKGGVDTIGKDSPTIKKLVSGKYTVVPSAPVAISFASGNRPPSTSNSKPVDPTAKAFNFNVQGQAAPGVKTSAHLSDKTHPHPGSGHKNPADLISSEEDERYNYLLMHGIVKKIEDEDKIIYAELPQIPGVLVVYRKPSERDANPERLNLDRRELTHMPLLEGEERLRLLNLQHNSICKIENLVSLPNLIFLDLLNNEIKEISQLHTVPTLKVLMLGQNRIQNIRNLQSLIHLDVLDLHGNKISKIEELGHLSELRVLNLENNQITTVENLNGLVSLSELNLRGNMIEVVNHLSFVPRLQRLFLSNNRISKFENISSLGDAHQLIELTLDGNPICSKPIPYYKFVLDTCHTLKSIDQTKITPEFRVSISAGSIEETQKNPNSFGKIETPAKRTTIYMYYYLIIIFN